MKKQLIILSGVSGSGKSTFAQLIQEPKVIVSADHYFYDENGLYNFDASKLKDAHMQCRNNARYEMKKGTPTVIVDNTNTSAWEYQPYIDMAKEYGYEVTRVIVDGSVHEGRNVHSVPTGAIKAQKERLINSLTD